MRRFIANSILALGLLVGGGLSYFQQGNESGVQAVSSPAFLGAQGGGAASIGGRGGVVMYVTNLNDSGSGSLRACAEASGPRNCVFKVAGLIVPASQIFVGSPFLTIDGQSAPGEVIIGGSTTPQEAGIRISTHDTIIRYVTFSPDNRNVLSGPGSGTVGYYIANTQDYNNIADHITSRWAGNKEIAIFAGFDGEYNRDYTLQYSMLYEPHAGHPVGPSISEQGILSNTQNSKNVDFHHDMLVNFSHRLPEYNHSPARWTNNITYNWLFYALAALGATQTDVIGNIWGCANLNAQGAQTYPIHSTDGNQGGSLPGTPGFYVFGNIGCGHTTPNSDQYGDLTRVITGENGNELGTFPSSWKRGTPLAASNSFPITVDDATTLSATLLPTIGNSQHLDCNGNWVPHRDAADKRIINEYQTHGTGGFWPNGVTTPITNQTSPDQIPTPSANWTDQPITGFPVCTESLGDGIPDQWKTAKGISTSDGNYYKTVQSNGFTGLENYMNGGLATGGGGTGSGGGTQVPLTISNVAVSNVTSTSAKVTWTTSNPANSTVNYGVCNNLLPTPTDNSLVTSHSVTLSGLIPSTNYSFNVESFDGTTTLQSAIQVFMTAAAVVSNPTQPTAPVLLSAVAPTQAFLLTWTGSPSAGVATYNVYRSTTSGTGYVRKAQVSTTQWTDTQVVSGQTFYYVVSAVAPADTVQESAFSNQLTVVIP